VSCPPFTSIPFTRLGSPPPNEAAISYFPGASSLKRYAPFTSVVWTAGFVSWPPISSTTTPGTGPSLSMTRPMIVPTLTSGDGFAAQARAGPARTTASTTAAARQRAFTRTDLRPDPIRVPLTGRPGRWA